MTDLRHSTTTWPDARPRRGIAGASWLRLAGVALTTLAIAAAALLLAALANRPPVPTAPLAGILATPGSYVGQQVVVNGRVEDLLTHRAFTLEASSSQGSLLALVEDSAVETAAGAAADGLSGYVPQLHGPLYRTDDPVKLVGTVERFDRATLTDQLDMVPSPQLFDSFEGQPVLVVEQLDTTDLLGVPSIAAPAAASELGTAAP